MRQPHKIPTSALVVIHDGGLRVLLLERADYPEHWQSVTGSQEPNESPAETATREVREETGIEATQFGGVVDWRLCNVYEIFPKWRHRYSPGTTHNIEHVFGLQVPNGLSIELAPSEHSAYRWLPWREAATQCFSWSNREAIMQLPVRATTRATRN